MRQTVMKSDRGREVSIETDDQGTTILDEQGVVIGLHGTDRHDEMVARHEQDGWHVTRAGTLRPPAAGAAGEPDQRPDDEAGPDIGPSS